MFNYALILFEGKITAVDETEAGRYFKMAADKGQAKAMYAYGVMLYKGISVPINETEASRYFKMASDKGGIDAMAMHAHMLTKRRGLCYWSACKLIFSDFIKSININR